MGLSFRKRENTTKYKSEQQLRPEELRQTRQQIESFNHNGRRNMPVNAGYYSNGKSTCPDKVRFAEKEKFTTKVFV